MASELFPAGGPIAHEDPDLTDEERSLAQRLAALRDLEPSERYRARGAAQLQQRIAEQPTRAAGLFWWLWLPQRRAPLALRFALVLCIALPALFGVSFAAAASLPGDSLYPLKRGVEDMRVSLSAPNMRLALLLDLAGRRLSEIGQLVARGADGEQVARASAEYQAAVERAAAYGPLVPADAATLRRQIAILMALEAQAPVGARAALEDARQAAERAAGTAPGAEPPIRPTEATATPPPTSTPRPTAPPTATATHRPAPSATPRPSATPTIEPTRTPTAQPSATPRPRPRPTPRPQPTAEPPTATPSPEPPVAEPPTAEPPTATPSPEPSIPPTERPRHREPRPTEPPREPTTPPQEPTTPPREPTRQPTEPPHEPTPRPTEPRHEPTATPRR